MAVKTAIIASLMSVNDNFGGGDDESREFVVDSPGSSLSADFHVGICFVGIDSSRCQTLEIYQLFLSLTVVPKRRTPGLMSRV
jgi:hypothetical protein